MFSNFQKMTSLKDEVQKLMSVDPKDLVMRSLRSLLKKHSDKLGHIKTVGKGRTKVAVIEDLKQWLEGNRSAEDKSGFCACSRCRPGNEMTELYKEVNKLARGIGEDFSVDAVRSLQNRYPDQFGHIKTAGKKGSSRPESLSRSGLKIWLKDNFHAAPARIPSGGNHSFNRMAEPTKRSKVLTNYLDTKNHSIIPRIHSEYESNGVFRDWDDVEQRVDGFKRTMITESNKECSFHFKPKIEHYGEMLYEVEYVRSK